MEELSKASVRWQRVALICLGLGLLLGLSGALWSRFDSWSDQPPLFESTIALEQQTLGQPLVLASDGLDRLALWFSRHGQAGRAAAEALLLRGTESPRSGAEIWRRLVGRWEVRVSGPGERVAVALPVGFELDERAGAGYFLLLRKKQGTRPARLSIWTTTQRAPGLSTAVALDPVAGVDFEPRAQNAALAVGLGHVPRRQLRALSWFATFWCGLGLLSLIWLALARRFAPQFAAPGRPADAEAGAGDAVAGPGRGLWGWLALSLLVGVGILIKVLFVDYGVIWDEEVQDAYGVFLLSYYAVWFPDPAVVDQVPLFNLHLYGGLFEWLVAVAKDALPLPGYDVRHAVTALVGLLGLAGVWALGRSLVSARAAFVALLALLLTPSYFGHMFINPKDLPFAVAYLWSLVFLVRLIRAWPRAAPQLGLRFGLAAGATMAVRVGAGVLLLYLLLFLVGVAALRLYRGGGPAAALRELGSSLAWVFAPAAGLAYAVMIFFWPWAQVRPIAHPWQALAAFAEWGASFSETVRFGGADIAADRLPPDYLARMFALKLPELLLLLLLVGLGCGLARLFRDRRGEPMRILAGLVVVVAALLPILVASLQGAVLYDGLRHFLFVLPLLALAAGYGADRGWAWLEQRAPSWGRAVVALLIIAYLCFHLSLLVRLHPYQYVYYNQLAGGLSGAAGSYETDYWASSYAEAVAELRRHLQRRHGPGAAQHRYRVSACRAGHAARTYFPANFVWVETAEQADFYIASTRRDCHLSKGGTPLLKVERLGVPLTYVLDLRGASGPGSSPAER